MKKRKIVPGDPKVAVGYLRVSSDEQKLGPDVQRASIEKWAKGERVRVVAWFTDRGVSGASEIEDRPGLVQALAALTEHKAGVFCVSVRDRLARDVAVKSFIERAVTNAGAIVVSADGVGNGESPTDQLMRDMLGVFAQFERAMARQRLGANIAYKRKTGLSYGCAPYGHKNHNGVLVEDKKEQVVVRAIMKLRDDGKSIRAIVAELKRRGMNGRSGPLAPTQIVRIIKRQGQT